LIGTTGRLLDASQNVTDTFTYDAFGVQTARTGSTVRPFGYAGRHGYQEDGDTGLKLLGHRYYDPTIGRFLTRDPIQDGRNWYAYCDNNPLNSVDPTGLFLETLADILGIAWDIWDIAHDPRNPWLWGGLNWSIGATFLPFIPGSYVAKIMARLGKFDWAPKFTPGAKSMEQFLKHLNGTIDAYQELQKRLRDLEKASGKAEKQRIQKEIDKIKKGIAGHEKEMDQKWPGWRKELERFKDEFENERK
jgi:RHS repeat-associated protein